MIISTEHKERLDQVAKGYAQELFKDMQVPKYQGENFTWKRFHLMVGRIVYASAFLSFSDEEFQPHYKDYAKKKAEEYAIKLVTDYEADN